MIIDSAKKVTSFFITSNVVKNDKEEIYQYGLELIFSSILNVLAVIIISIIANKFFESLCFLTFFITLRSYAGGIHSSSYRKCFITFLSIYSIIIFLYFVIPVSIQYAISVVAMLFACLIIFLFSPVADANKPLDLEERKKYRTISIIIILVQSSLIAIGILINFHIERLIFASMTGSFTVALLVLAAKVIKRKE